MEFYKNLDKAMENFTKRGAFLTVKGEDGVNTMTISWGYIGFSWRKPYFVAMVRPERYTAEFLQTAKDFTVSIPYGDNMNEAIQICGTNSGENIDKEKEAKVKFRIANKVESPVIDNCNMYYECEISYVDKINGAQLPDDINEEVYEKEDYHYMYYGEIVDCYEK